MYTNPHGSELCDLKDECIFFMKHIYNATSRLDIIIWGIYVIWYPNMPCAILVFTSLNKLIAWFGIRIIKHAYRIVKYWDRDNITAISKWVLGHIAKGGVITISFAIYMLTKN